MKKFLVDQGLLLIVAIAMSIVIPSLFPLHITIILEIVLVISWSYLCRRILLIPFDLIVDKATKTVYFSEQYGKENFEFFKKSTCSQWKFYFGNKQTLRLLVPNPIETTTDNNRVVPLHDEKITIIYYRFSKILLKWEPA